MWTWPCHKQKMSKLAMNSSHCTVRLRFESIKCFFFFTKMKQEEARMHWALGFYQTTNNCRHAQISGNPGCTKDQLPRIVALPGNKEKSLLEQNTTLATTVSSWRCDFVQQGVEKVIFSNHPGTKKTHTQKKNMLKNTEKYSMFEMCGHKTVTLLFKLYGRSVKRWWNNFWITDLQQIKEK